MLFFGCQYKSMDLYKTDKMEMLNEGVLDKTYLALSRDPTIPKVSAREYMCSKGEKNKNH
jgi:nitric-oxide synthase